MTQAAATSTTNPIPPASARPVADRLADAVTRFKRPDAASAAGRDAPAPAASEPADPDELEAVAPRKRYRGLDRLGRAVAAMGGVEDLVTQAAANGPFLTLDAVSADRQSVLLGLVLDELRIAEHGLECEHIQRIGAQSPK
jgi:hypothetical protein